MKYTDEETIREIVQRGRSIRDRRNYGRLCLLGGLSIGLAVALIVVLLTGVSLRIGNKGGPGGDVAVAATTETGTNQSGSDITETKEDVTPPVEFANIPGSEDGMSEMNPGGTPIVGGDPGEDIPGGTPGSIPGGSGLPPEMPQQAEKVWIDKPWELEAAAASVLKLETYDATGQRICSGSGFIAFDRRFLITARHVVVNMDHLTATMDWGETFEVREVIAVDADQDIAICRIPEGIEMAPLTVSDTIETRGEKVAAIGSQFGAVNLITTGMLSGYWTSGDIERILFTAPVASGSSGGPVFNSRGEVIGVVSGTYDGGQNLNFAVPIQRVYTLIESEMEVNEE